MALIMQKRHLRKTQLTVCETSILWGYLIKKYKKKQLTNNNYKNKKIKRFKFGNFE
jgi:hypothetical protein